MTRDLGYRSGGDDNAKRHDAAMAAVRERAAVREMATPLRPGEVLIKRERVTNVIQVTEPGYDVVLFFNDDGGAEAVISRPNDKPTGVNIAPPAPGRRIVVERTGDRFAVVYRDAPK